MSKKSNSYILFYTIVITVVCGSLLGLASEALKPFKEANVAFDTKKNILATAVDIKGKSAKEVEALYTKLVRASYVVDANGQKIEGLKPEAVSISDEYRKDLKERKLPVYELGSQEKPEETAYYVLPMWGFGLWDSIWGYVAIKSDFETVQGTVFLHKGETPGLGARIAEEEIQQRFAGKKIADNGKYLAMQKGEGNNYDGQPVQVDGMSGATITGQGLNKMLAAYFEAYKAYLEAKAKGSGKMSLLN